MDGLQSKSVKGTKTIDYILGIGFSCHQIQLVIWASKLKTIKEVKTNFILMFCHF